MSENVTRKRIKIISQTGSDMSLEEAERLGIELIPDIVRFKNEEFRVRYEISDRDFYERMQAEKELPTSSHPSVGDFVKSYTAAKEAGADEIVCITVTSKMSGSYDTALAAKRMMERRGAGAAVYVYDSAQCSHGVVPLLREAARLAADGISACEIIKALDELKGRIAVYFMLDTLENAQKGGRVGKIKAAAADFLGLKPVLVFKDGACEDFLVARNYAGGVRKLTELFKADVDPSYGVTVFHGNVPEKAEEIKKMIETERKECSVSAEYVGSVIGIFSGSGAIGIAYVRRN